MGFFKFLQLIVALSVFAGLATSMPSCGGQTTEQRLKDTLNPRNVPWRVKVLVNGSTKIMRADSSLLPGDTVLLGTKIVLIERVK